MVFVDTLVVAAVVAGAAESQIAVAAVVEDILVAAAEDNLEVAAGDTLVVAAEKIPVASFAASAAVAVATQNQRVALEELGQEQASRRWEETILLSRYTHPTTRHQIVQAWL